MPKLGPRTRVRLNDGVEMPLLGLGTWDTDRGIRGRKLIRQGKGSLSAAEMHAHTKEEQHMIDAIKYAVIECGYRHLDSAIVYESEKVIGVALQEIFAETALKREDIFMTTKVRCTYTHNT